MGMTSLDKSPSYRPDSGMLRHDETAGPASGQDDIKTLARLLKRRQSCRDYSAMPVPLRAMLHLVKTAQGPSGKSGARTAPSAHGVYPLRLYLLARRVEGLDPGIYRYTGDGRMADCETGHTLVDAEGDIEGQEARHGLEVFASSLPEGALVSASLADDTWLDSAAAIVVIAADRPRAIQHFSDQSADGLRGARYVDIEAGAVIQNLYLATAALGLGGVVVMGFDEARMQRLVPLEPGFDLVALYCVGDPVLSG